MQHAPLAAPFATVTLATRLAALRHTVEDKVMALPAPHPSVVLIFSVSDGATRAVTAQGTGEDFATAWAAAEAQLHAVMRKRKLEGRFLRLDWVDQVHPATWADFAKMLQQVKRNYSRCGISFDPNFTRAFTEQELNGSAVLYGGNTISHAVINDKNLLVALQQKYGSAEVLMYQPDSKIWLFDSLGAYCGEDGKVWLLHGRGRDAGRRILPDLSPEVLRPVLRAASDFLARQVLPDGRFIYGYHPCFDRQIEAYNALRHASTLFSMLEAWEVLRTPSLMLAIRKGLDYLCDQLTHEREGMAFVVDSGGEVKLGANATALLALSKFTALTGEGTYAALMEKLALGILFMQQEDGSFLHVYQWPDLSLKQAFRIVYYEGEAAYALMRLYSLTKDPRWIASVERAFEHFIAKDYWKHHDHWLSYCTNELTLYRPDLRYFQFGIQNFNDYLDFVTTRITTFPTLLELMMAGRKMLDRLAQIPQGAELLAQVDAQAFDKALHTRAHYLMNGHFWPEYAMYFRNPDRILGAFFIRHHAFRVRIDDVEHYLSGLIAYMTYHQHPQGEGAALV